jgi:cobalt-zinc-cadmium efflux system outer membrane protein
VALYQLQLDKGNVPLKEVVRLKAFLFGLESERKDLAFQIATEQANFLTLLCARENAYVRPVVQKAALDSLRPAQLDFGNLLKLAQANRYDLRGLEAQTRLAQANLSYQRALAVPDLTAQFNYEATGNFANRYTGIGVGVPLPMFNRNQGNIKAAKANIDAAGATFQNAQLSVEKDVLEAWQKALYADRVYQEFDRGFEGQFDDLIGNIVTSYQRSIIGVVEFLDYYESYKNSALQRNRLQNDRMNALEQLQFAVGVPVLTY